MSAHREGLQQQILRKLEDKYEITLNFYKSKQINQILSLDSRYRVYMDYCDSRCISQDFEYLKRMYYYKSPSGKPELTQRMKMISQHYATNPALSTFTYEYPMMVVTNTKSLFMRRKRRLRKIGVGQGSSDDTEEQEEDYPGFQYPTQYFLENLDQSSFTQKEEAESSISYQSQSYDIFEDSQLKIGNNIQVYHLDSSETALKQLIDDFSAPNDIWRYQQVSTSYHPKNALVSIENHSKLKRDSVEVTPIEDTLKINKKEKRSDIFSSYVQQLLLKPISFSDFGLSRNAAVQEYNHLPVVSEPPSIQQQREERASRRKKIREKAEQLLKRVRNEQEKNRPS